MVDEMKDNHIDRSVDKAVEKAIPEPVDQPAWLVVIGLLGAFRELVDDGNALLAERGHPGVRPAHGFALQAVGTGATAGEVATRLGVSKQAAAKTLATLEADGYVRRTGDPSDARRKIVAPTARGRSLLAESTAAFEQVLDGWRARVGARRVDDLAEILDRLGAARSARVDLGAWSS